MGSVQVPLTQEDRAQQNQGYILHCFIACFDTNLETLSQRFFRGLQFVCRKVNVTSNIQRPSQQMFIVNLSSQSHGIVSQLCRGIEICPMQVEVCRAEEQFRQNFFIAVSACFFKKDAAAFQSFHEMTVQIPE